MERKIEQELDQLGLLATKDCPQPRSFEAADMSQLPYLTRVIKAR